MTKLQVAIRAALAEVKPHKDVEDIAKDSGLKASRIYNITTGRTKVTDDDIARLRKAFGKPEAWPEDEGQLVSLSGTPLYPVPVVGEVEGGDGAYNVDPDKREVFVPKKLQDLGGLGWVVRGESMMPSLEPDMIALFREHRNPKPRHTFLVKSPEGKLRVKNLEWGPEGWMLVSLNPANPPEHLGEHELQGFLIGWYYAKGTREKMDTDPLGIYLDGRPVI